MSSTPTKRGLLGSSLLMGSVRASAQGTAPTIRLGILNDQSSTYEDNGGPGSVAYMRLAVSEFATKLGLHVAIISAAHQNKPDVAAGIARQWLDQGVDALCDIQGSAIALAVSNIVREWNKVMLAFNIGSAEVTGRSCTPNIVHFVYGSYMLSRRGHGLGAGRG